jgi:hypothetical protein
MAMPVALLHPMRRNQRLGDARGDRVGFAVGQPLIAIDDEADVFVLFAEMREIIGERGRRDRDHRQIDAMLLECGDGHHPARAGQRFGDRANPDVQLGWHLCRSPSWCSTLSSLWRRKLPGKSLDPAFAR